MGKKYTSWNGAQFEYVHTNTGFEKNIYDITEQYIVGN